MKNKIYLIALILIAGAFSAKAQTADTAKTDTQKFAPVDIEPEVVGGFGALGKYINTNIKYPKAARKNNIQGRVILTFIIERDGSLTDMKVKNSLSPETDAEAIRLMSDPKAPKWMPGSQGGRPVRVQYSIPINFILEN